MKICMIVEDEVKSVPCSIFSNSKVGNPTVVKAHLIFSRPTYFMISGYAYGIAVTMCFHLIVLEWLSLSVSIQTIVHSARFLMTCNMIL